MFESITKMFSSSQDQSTQDEEDEDNEVFESEVNDGVESTNRIDEIEKKLDEVVNQAERTESKMTQVEDQVSELESKTEAVDDRTTSLMGMYDEFMTDENPLKDQESADSTNPDTTLVASESENHDGMNSEDELVFESPSDEESDHSDKIVVADDVYPVNRLSDYTSVVSCLRGFKSYKLRVQVLEKLVHQGFITNELSEELQRRLDEEAVEIEVDDMGEIGELRMDMFFEQVTAVIAEESDKI